LKLVTLVKPLRKALPAWLFEFYASIPRLKKILMSDITCVIVDDEKYVVDMLCDYVEQTPGLNLGFATTSALEAFSWLSANKAHVCISDISMPDLSGLRLVETLGNHVKFIFCTAHPQYAHTGYDLDVVDYLVKPVNYHRFLKAIHKLRQVLHLPVNGPDAGDAISITVGAKGQLLRVPLADVHLFEAKRNYVAVHTQVTKPHWYISIKAMMHLLPPDFLQVHKSYVVRISAINLVDGNTIILKTGQQVPVGATYKQALLNILKKKQ
jgi:DNA-binding LytR/AlgR family response regulator